MKPNYNQLSKEELNRASAEMLGFVYTYKKSGSGPIYNHYLDKCGDYVCTISEWNPTDKDSAQLQNYVIPKLLGKGNIEITTQRTGNTFYMTIVKEGVKVASKLTTDPDKINETIARCCLEAWEAVK